MIRIIALAFCLCHAIGAGTGPAGVLEAQAAAWNRGNLAAFVETYEDSPAITFLGKTLTRGRAEVLERYRREYGTPQRMGKLRFEIIETRPLGEGHALVLGRFFLTRSAAGGGDAAGNFTLVMRKGPMGWKIVHDHTS